MKKVSDLELVNYIDDYIVKHGYPPSYRDIGLNLGLSSSATIYCRIKKLINKGLLESDHEGSPRALRSPRIKIEYK